MRVYGFETETTRALQALVPQDIALRWGGDQVPEAINGSVHLLNSLEQLQAFKKARILCPVWTTDPKTRDGWVAREHTVLGRKLNHTQGFDIVVPGTMKANQRWQSRDLWTVYHETGPEAQEWRVHVMKDRNGNYRSIARGLKYMPDPAAAEALRPKLWKRQGIIVRSRRLGWHMRHDAKTPEAVREIAKQAVTAVGYDLGAVDILNGSNGPMVLEVNSRPAMRDEYTIAAYAGFIRRHYGDA
jgi:hypothetical protein